MEKTKRIIIDFLTDSRQSLVDLLHQCDPKIAMLWSCECAERVLWMFETVVPNDLRPRLAIEAGRTWVRGECRVGFCRNAALATHAAARDVGPGAACFAARAAGHAAATAHVATHAIGGADYAIKAIVLSSDPALENQANQEEREWQRTRLLHLMSQANAT